MGLGMDEWGVNAIGVNLGGWTHIVQSTHKQIYVLYVQNSVNMWIG